ncbi:MAG: c-type cytochrome [Cyclobacteriaceae bacterium]|jgi:cytochrome c
MRRIMMLITVATVVFACGSKNESTNTEDYGEAEVPTEAAVVDENLIGQGAALVKQNDCNTCHHVTSQIVGPAHTDVAKKYEFTNENIKMIAERIIKGSTGVWGPVMMTPHPNLSQADAEKMARYVLSLDGEKEPE